jgi:hypothetical protein
LLNEAAARRGKGMIWRFALFGRDGDLHSLCFHPYWLTAGQQTGWRCDQPRTVSTLLCI